MANPFVKAWKYFMAWFGAKVDEQADPKIQIQQAIEDAQRQHQALAQQAAAVIGNQRQLEMKLSRQMSARSSGCRPRPGRRWCSPTRPGPRATRRRRPSTSRPRRSSPPSWSPPSSRWRTSRRLHDQALQAAAQARKAVENNAMLLQQKLAERTKLLSQLEQAKMQETVASVAASRCRELAAPGNTPSLDEVREKIERRYANALGRPSSPPTRSRAGCSRSRSRPSTWPATRGWSRSGPA